MTAARFFFISASLFGVLLQAAPGLAATYTWNTSGGTAWSASTNWSSNAPGIGDVAQFAGGSYGSQPTLGSTASVGGIWDTGSGAIIITGTTLTLSGTLNINGNATTGIELDPAAGSLTVSAPIVLGGAQQWLNNSATGTLLVNGPTVNNGGFLLTMAGSGSTTIGASISGAGGLTMAGPGSVNLTGSNTYAGTTFVNGGTLSITGSAASAGGGSLIVGNAGTGVLNLAANTASSFGNSSNVIIGEPGYSGALNMSAGTVNLFTASSGNYLAIGGSGSTTFVGGYGAFNMSGGTLITNDASGLRVGEDGEGVMTQSGGYLSTARYFVVGFQTSGVGVDTITGGTTSVSSSYRSIVGNNAGGVGTLNIGTQAGGAGVFSTPSISMADSTGDSATINLSSGTLAINGGGNGTSGLGIYNSSATAVFNFNGGVLNAIGNNLTLINNTLTSVNVYKGGAIINMTASAGTISANLLAVSGSGVYPTSGSFATTSGTGGGGSGYIGAPQVTVSGGGGSGAQAIATMTNGAITGVTITNPGSGYAAGSTLTFAFVGGGATSAATAFQYTLQSGDLASNVGGLTKVGAGILSLTGSNSYTGITAINGGELSLGSAAALGNVSTISFGGGALQFTSANTTDYSVLGRFSNAANQPYRFDTNSLAVTLAGSLNSTGGSLTKVGLGNLILAGTSNYSGLTSVSAGSLTVNGATNSAGAVQVAAGAVLAGSGSVGNATILSGGTLAGGFNGAGNLILANLTYDASSGYTASGNLSNLSIVGSLTKTGVGNLLLSGPSYAGLTSVAGGTLTANNTTIAGPVQVLSAAVLSGTGSVGNTTLLNGGVLTPGQSGAGTFTTGNLIFGASAGNTATVNISNLLSATPGTLQVNGNITALGGPNTVTLSINTNPGTGTYPLIGYTGSLTGSSALAVSVPNLGARSTANLLYPAGQVELQLQIAYPIWTGANGTAWTTTPSALNWKLNTNGNPTYYIQGDNVVFDDTAGSNQVVSVSGSNVSPTAVQFNNSTYTYLLQGAYGITGSASVTFNGSAGVTLANSNSYTGGTTINADTVTLANANALPSGPGTGSVVISSTGSGIIDLDGTPAASINGLSGGGGIATGQIINSGTGTLSTLNVGVGNGSGTFAGIIADNNGTGGRIALTMAGSGTEMLTAANTFSGPTAVNSGTLALGNSLALQNSTLGIGSSGTVSFIGVTAGTLGGLQGSGNLPLVNTSSASVALTVGNNSSTTTYGGAMSGGGSLTLIGSGSLTLTGSSTYTGGTTVSSGTLNIAGSGANTGGGAINVGTAGINAVLNITSTGTVIASATNIGNTGFAGAVNQTAGFFNPQSGGYIGVGNGGYGYLSLSGGTMANTGSSGIRVGAATGGIGIFNQSGGLYQATRYLVIAGNNGNSTGVYTLTGGTSIGSTGYSILIGDVGGGIATFNIGTAAGGNGLLVSQASAGLQVADAGVTTGLSILNINRGTVQLTAGTIREAGTGTGAVNFNGGTVQAGAAGLTLIDNSPTGGVNIFNGGAVFDTQGFTATVTSNLLAPSGSGAYIAGGSLALAASNGGSGYIGAPLVTINGGSGTGASAVANVVNGVVTGITMTNPGQGYLAGDQLTFNFSGGGDSAAATPLTYTLLPTDAVANGAGTVTKVGTGTLVLNGASSTYSGGTVISAGTLQPGNASALGTGNVIFSNSNASALDLDGQPVVYVAGLSGGSSGLGGQVINSGLGTSTLTLLGGGATFSGVIANNNGTGGLVALAMNGTGTQTLAGASTFTGLTTANGGTLALANGLALQNSTLDVEAGSVGFVGITSGTIGGLQGVGNLTLNNAAGQNFNLYVGNNATNTTFAGALIGSGGLTKIGTGAFTLTGANSYSGATSVATGKLYVNGSLSPTGAVQVVSGGTLGGQGSVGNTTVLSGGAIEAGQGGFGTLTLNSLTLGANTGNMATINIVNAAVNPTTLQVNGNITSLGGSNTVTVNLDSTPTTGSYVLIDYTGSMSGFNAFKAAVPGLGARSTATLVNLPALGEVELNVQIAYPIWTGAHGTAWTTATSVLNWELNTNAAPTYYIQGDNVVFDDTPGSNQVVSVSGSNVSPNSVVFNNNSFTYSLQGAFGIAGSTSVAINGSAGVIFANSNSYTGGTVINAGTVTLGSASAFPSGPGTGSVVVSSTGSGIIDLNGTPNAYMNGLSGGGGISSAQLINSATGTLATLNIGLGDGTATFNGIIADNNGIGGQLAIAKVGSGTETFAAANTYSGPTNVSNGTLALANSLALQNSTVSIGSSGSVAFVAGITAATFGGLQGSGNLPMINNLAQPIFLTVGNNGNSTYSGALSSAGTLTTVGTGSIAFTGSNTYTGDTNVNGGNVSFIGPTAYSGNLYVNSGNVAYLGGAYRSGAGSANIYGGNVTVAGPNSYTGGTYVSAGTLNYTGSASVLGVGQLQVAASAASTVAVVNISSSGTLEFDGANFQLGYFSNSAGAINQSAGYVSLGLANNYYLQIGGGNSSGDGTAYGSYVLSGGTLAASTYPSGIRDGTGGMGSFLQTGGLVTCPRYFVVGGNCTSGFNNGVATFLGGSTIVGSGGYFTIIGNLFGSVGVMNVGTEAGGNATFSQVTSGGIQVGQVAGAIGTLNINSGLLSLAGPIQTPSTTATGNLNLNGGTIQAATSTTLISNTITYANVFNGGTTIDTQGYTATVAASLLAPSGSGVYLVGGSLGLSSSNGGSGYIGAPLVTVTDTTGNGSGATAIANVVNGVVTGVTLTSPGQGYSAGDVLNFAFAGGGDSVAATTLSYTLQRTDVAANTAGILTKVGSGTLILSGPASTYTGGTIVSAGSLQLGSNSALGTGGLTISAGTVDLAGYSPTIASLSGRTTTELTNTLASAAVLTLAQSNTTTYAGTITDGVGTVGLTLNGPGQLTLSGSNGFSGGTTVSSGVLILDGADALLAGSSLTIGSPTTPGAVFAPPAVAHPSADLAPVPEPSTFLMLAIAGILGVGLSRRSLAKRAQGDC